MARKYNLIFLLILTAALSLVVLSLKQVQFHGSADEGYYYGYAQGVCQKGLSVYADFFRDYSSMPEHWLMPNPFRAGFIVPCGILFKLSGSSFFSLLLFSLLSYVLFLIAAFYFSSKYFGKRIALLLSALLAFSPLNMAASRRCLPDSAVNLFTLLSIFLFWEYLGDRKNRARLWLFILTFAFNILIKESSLILGVVFVLYLLLERLYYKIRISLIDYLACSVIPFLIWLFLIVLLGGWKYLFIIGKIILTSPGSNNYAMLFGQGPWFRYLIDYFLISPWIFIFGLSFIFYHLLTGEKKRGLASYYIFIFALTLAIFDLFTKNVRYVSMLDFPLRLFALLLLDRFAQRLFPKKATLMLALAVAAIAVFDYLNFYNFFIVYKIYDPVSYFLLGAKRMIPI